MQPLQINLSEPGTLDIAIRDAPSLLRMQLQTPLGMVMRVLKDTTENWNSHPEFIPGRNEVIVYVDKETITDGEGHTVAIPGIKIGDGLAYCIDLPFIGDEITAALTQHISDTTIHITQAEREFWNAKLNYYMDEDTLVLSRD